MLIYCNKELDRKDKYSFVGNLSVKYKLVADAKEHEVSASNVFWNYFTFSNKSMVAIVANDIREVLNTETKNIASMAITCLENNNE